MIQYIKGMNDACNIFVTQVKRYAFTVYSILFKLMSKNNSTIDII